jgi:hypothetical protein
MKRICFYLCLIVGRGGGDSQNKRAQDEAIPNSGLTPKHVRLKIIMNLDICKLVRLKRGRVLAPTH